LNGNGRHEGRVLERQIARVLRGVERPGTEFPVLITAWSIAVLLSNVASGNACITDMPDFICIDLSVGLDSAPLWRTTSRRRRVGAAGLVARGITFSPIRTPAATVNARRVVSDQRCWNATKSSTPGAFFKTSSPRMSSRSSDLHPPTQSVDSRIGAIALLSRGVYGDRKSEMNRPQWRAAGWHVAGD
jgi:hypothetical protein